MTNPFYILKLIVILLFINAKVSGQILNLSHPVKRDSLIKRNPNLDKVPINPLVILDNDTIDLETFHKLEINPNEIKSIKVLNSKKATARFGEKGKNGALLVKKKKSENNKIK